MRSSTVVILVLGLLCASLTAAETQQAKEVFRVGLLSTANPRSVFVAFEQRLRELGYVEGHNFVFEFRNAEGQVDRLPNLAAELVRLQVDVIVAPGPEATLQAARHATSTIPIVMIAINYDPIARGYVDGLARPGRNITGVFFLQLELTAKRLELLREALPHATRVFAIWDVHTADQLRAAEAAAQSLGMQLQALELRNPPYDFEDAIGVAIRERAQALVVLSSPIFFLKRVQLTALAMKNRLPAIFLLREYAEAGGLMAYGVSLSAMHRRAAEYVDKILKGTKPADLPVELPRQFELVINLKTAKALGLTIPPSLLFQADTVIK